VDKIMVIIQIRFLDKFVSPIRIHNLFVEKLWLLYKFVSRAISFPHPNPQFICGKIMVIIHIRFSQTLSVLSALSCVPSVARMQGSKLSPDL
jgi:hypothetical protein